MFSDVKWICAGEDFSESLPSFQKKFVPKGKVKQAIAYITAFGVYDFFVDGKKVGNQIMAPGWTYYKKWIQYQEYDITDLLREESTLSVTVAPGWACGFIGFTRKSYDEYPVPYGIKIPSMMAKIVVTYFDHEEEIFCSDESWDVYTTETLYCQLYDGQRVDFTKQPHFVRKAVVCEQPVPKLLPQIGENVVERETVLPKELILTPKGERVIDFGQNLAGYLQVRVKGKKGDVVSFSYGEVLDRDGNFYNENYRDAKNETTYILDGTERTLKPSLTFQGFRYVRVDNFPGEIDLEDFVAKVIYSDMKRVGDFSCGNEKLNQLYSNLIWSQRGNYIDIPTDCPQRNERLGWTGDAQVFCRTAALNYNVKRFFRKWLHDMGQNQGEDGAVYGIIPTLDHLTAKVSTAWGDAATVCPWEMYRAYGDLEFLRDCYPMMKKWVEYMRNFGDEEYLFVGGNHYGDWLAMDAGEDYYVGATQTDLIASAYFAYSVDLTVKAGKALGEDTAELEALYQNVRSAFREAFMENGMPRVYPKADGLAENRENTVQMNRPVKPVTQTAILLILHFGLCEEKEREALVEKLAELIRDFDGKMTTGFVGTPLILRVLSDNGRADLAFDLLLQEKNPSWLFSVNHGATTIWEHWNSQKEDGTFWSTRMNSFNHYAYGSVYDWMFGDMVGLTVCEDGVGYEKITYRPHADKRIGFARASLETARGTLSASWKYLPDGAVRYELTLPETTTARVTIPGLPERTLTGGNYVFYSKS